MDQVASLSKQVESLRIELRRSSRSRLIEQSEAFVGPKGQMRERGRIGIGGCPRFLLRGLLRLSWIGARFLPGAAGGEPTFAWT